MPEYIDQTTRAVFIAQIPKRIISLVPSQTELLADLGLDAEVCGITKFCVHPESWFRSKQRVGGTKNLNIELIRSLKPDLIIANKEENTKEQVELLADEFPVWISDVTDLSGALDMIASLSGICDRRNQGSLLIDEIKNEFSTLNDELHPVRTAYLIWKEPYMTVGGDTFIHSMLQRAGFENVYANSSRYPIVDLEELVVRNCELILLSTEPYPFKEQHLQELQAALKTMKISLADGEMFSWYGSRLRKAPAYFKWLRQSIQAAASP